MRARTAVAMGAATAVLGAPGLASAAPKPLIRHGFPVAATVGARVPVSTAYGESGGKPCKLRLDEQVNDGRWAQVATATGTLIRYTGALQPGARYRYRAKKTCGRSTTTQVGRRFVVKVYDDGDKAFTYTKPEGKNEGLSPWEAYRSPQFLGGTAHGTPDTNNGTVKFAGFAAGWVGSTPEDEGPVAGIKLDGGPDDQMRQGNELVPPHAYRRVLWASKTLSAGKHSARFVVYDDTATVDAFVVLVDR